MPKPLAVYCINDSFAADAARTCIEAGLKVPDDVAVLGSEDDGFLCRRARPYLSSIHLPYERIGYEAARTLDLLMQGKPVPERLDLPPTSITARQSTDTLAINDEVVRRVIAYIREHAAESPSLQDLTREAGISQSLLYRRFRTILGRTPQQLIIQEKLKVAKSLLRSTSLSIGAVAEKAGFGSDQHLHHTFRQKTGQSPGAYRKGLQG